MAAADVTVREMLEYATSFAGWISLHISPPGRTGVNEMPSAYGYERQPAVWAPATGRSIRLDNVPVFQFEAALLSPIEGWGAWTEQTGGVFKFGANLNAVHPIPIGVDSEFRLTLARWVMGDCE